MVKENKKSSYKRLKENVSRVTRPIYQDVKKSGKDILGDIREIQRPSERIAQQTTDLFRPTNFNRRIDNSTLVDKKRKMFDPLGMNKLFRRRQTKKKILRYVNLDGKIYAELVTGEYVPAETF